MKQIILILGCLLFLDSCKSEQDNGKTYNKAFVIGEIPNKKDFLNLSDHEKAIDSLFVNSDKQMDSLASLDKTLAGYFLKNNRKFTNNRGRIFLTSFTNNKQGNIDKAFTTGMPAPCDCWVKKDSIFISMGIGFFGGMVFHINLEKEKFHSSFYQYIDDGKPYKASMKDSFTNQIEIPNKYQYLVLEDRPSFKPDQQLNGYLTMTTSDYYEQASGNILDTNYYKGKIYFTCTTK